MNAPARATASPRNEVAVIAPPRLPYPPAVEQRFGIDKAAWKALVEAIYPAAQSPDSVILALSYCRARKLDPFKRVIHIVPVWDSQQRRMVETVWPGIAELRTTAFRTGDFAGRDPSEFGPTINRKVGSTQIEFPEWAQVTVYRIVKGVRCPFPGPRVYWLEAYAQAKRDDASPNSMWAKRPRGQLDKCAEAAALRAAFPEEIGGELIDDEAHGRYDAVDPAPPRPARADFVEGEATVHGESTDGREAAGEDATQPTADAAASDELDLSAWKIDLPRKKDGAPDFVTWRNEFLSALGDAGDETAIESLVQANLDVYDEMEAVDAKGLAALREKIGEARRRVAGAAEPKA